MNKTLFFVEDELFVALDIQDVFEEAGWTVEGPISTIHESLKALEARAQLPSCALLDVRLVDGDVYEVADILHADGVPIIFHSGHADVTMLESRYPGCQVCNKPFLPDRLEEVASRVMLPLASAAVADIDCQVKC